MMKSESFLGKLKSLIVEHLDDENFGVSELAKKMSFSRSQLLRKVKAETGSSVSRLIRDIRLEEAARMVIESDLNASEIAYRTGFSSPSYFSRCFHEKFGCTPGEYSKKGHQHPYKHNEKPLPLKPGKLAMIIFGSVIMILTGWLILERLASSNPVEQADQQSIAVLPLTDLSEETDKGHIAIGLTDAIIMELSKLEGLRVISRGSAMQFRDSVAMYPRIAELLGVDLLLEGSIIYHKDSMRVNVQLIDPAPLEKHIWSNAYEQNTENILTLAQDISTRIAREIHLAISFNKPDKNTRQLNPHAYELYLRGKLLYDQQSPASIRKSIAYLKRSLTTDSTFAPAYVTLAECFITMNKFTRNHEEKLENRRESREAIDKALKKAITLDNELAEAYMTKANVMGSFDWDWEAMKELVEKGLTLNPNSAYGHQLMSKYYAVKGNMNRSVKEARIAERLDPLNPALATIVGNRLMLCGAYDDAVKQFLKVLEIYPNYGWAWNDLGIVYYLMDRRNDALNAWKELHRVMGNDQIVEYYSRENFDNAIKFWLSEATGPSKPLCSNPSIIAMAHLFANDANGSLEYLEYAFEVKTVDLPEIMVYPVFRLISDDPRFKEITKSLDIHLVK